MSERIAEIMHSLFCTKQHGEGHEDRCLWYEEMIVSPLPWDEQTHLYWLKQTEDRMKLDDMNEQSVIAVVNQLTRLDFSKCIVRQLVRRFLEIAER